MGPIGYKNDCLVTLGISRKIETLILTQVLRTTAVERWEGLKYD